MRFQQLIERVARTPCPVNTKVPNEYGPNPECSEDKIVPIARRGPKGCPHGTLYFQGAEPGLCVGCAFKKAWTQHTACLNPSLILSCTTLTKQWTADKWYRIEIGAKLIQSGHLVFARQDCSQDTGAGGWHKGSQAKQHSDIKGLPSSDR